MIQQGKTDQYDLYCSYAGKRSIISNDYNNKNRILEKGYDFLFGRAPAGRAVAPSPRVLL
jgi:hypothetical protein